MPQALPYRRRGILYDMVRRQSRDAERDLSKAVELDRTDADNLRARATLYGRIGRLPEALADFEAGTPACVRACLRDGHEILTEACAGCNQLWLSHRRTSISRSTARTFCSGLGATATQSLPMAKRYR